LTAAHAETLQALLCSALPALEPLRFANTQTVDLAGLQLVLAYARARSALKLEPLCAALPLPLRSALSLTGCLDAAGHLDGNLWT
jgi:hypothetical protein